MRWMSGAITTLLMVLDATSVATPVATPVKISMAFATSDQSTVEQKQRQNQYAEKNFCKFMCPKVD